MTDDEGARTLGPVEEAAEELARAWVRTAHEASVRLRQQAQREADAIVADAKRILAAAEAQVARLHAYAAEVTDGLAGLTRRPEEPAAWDPLGLRVEDAPCQGEGRSAPGAGPAPSVAPVPGAGAPAGERNGAPAAPVVSVNGDTTPAFRVVPSAADVDVEPAPVPAGEVASAYVPLLGSRGRHLPSGPGGAGQAARSPSSGGDSPGPSPDPALAFPADAAERRGGPGRWGRSS